MKIYRLFWPLVLTFAVMGEAPGAEIQPWPAVGSTPLPRDLGPGPVDVWNGGALLSLSNNESAAPVLRLTDKAGNAGEPFSLRLPDARWVHVSSGCFARGADGSLALGGIAASADSRAAEFVAWISPGRQKQTIIRVSPYLTRALTVASDGSIWTAGSESGAGQAPNPDYAVIRRYDPDGRLLGSFLPNSELPARGIWTPAHSSLLASSKDRIGWYSEIANTYIEFANDGTILSRFAAAGSAPKRHVNGLGACDNGRVFISAHYKTDAGQGWMLFELDRSAGTWKTIPRSEPGGYLAGCHDNELAVELGGYAITWLKPGPK